VDFSCAIAFLAPLKLLAEKWEKQKMHMEFIFHVLVSQNMKLYVLEGYHPPKGILVLFYLLS
jgi:hypothetical protein